MATDYAPKHAKPSLLDRVLSWNRTSAGEGNPATQTAPYGQATQGDTKTVTQLMEEIDALERQLEEQHADMINRQSLGVPAPVNDNGVYAPPTRQAAGANHEAGATPLTNWGKVVSCPDCRGEGDCTACADAITSSDGAAACAYCGGSKVCPSCKSSGYVRIAPAEKSAKAEALEMLEQGVDVVTAAVIPDEIAEILKVEADGPLEALGARVIAEIGEFRFIGTVRSVSGNRMDVQWADGKQSVESVEDFTFLGG